MKKSKIIKWYILFSILALSVGLAHDLYVLHQEKAFYQELSDYDSRRDYDPNTVTIQKPSKYALQKPLPSYNGTFAMFSYGTWNVTYPRVWATQMKIADCSNGTTQELVYCHGFETKGVYGTYYPSSYSILISPWNASLMPGAVVHELSHHLWRVFLDKDYKDVYCTVAGSLDVNITHYANKNCGENFAEAFSVYYLTGKCMPEQCWLLEEAWKTVQ